MAPSIIDLTKSRGRRLIPGDQFVLHTKGSEELNERTGWRNFFQEGDTLSCPTPDKPVMEILLGSGGTELMEAKRNSAVRVDLTEDLFSEARLATKGKER